ncbi:hypothetical protein C8R44DRAFT_738184 [Mycena epipterygia]|nr:hypothetical protein C8R44DRAFT_738184 [Mycena epipterygia]
MSQPTACHSIIRISCLLELGLTGCNDSGVGLTAVGWLGGPGSYCGGGISYVGGGDGWEDRVGRKTWRELGMGAAPCDSLGRFADRIIQKPVILSLASKVAGAKIYLANVKLFRNSCNEIRTAITSWLVHGSGNNVIDNNDTTQDVPSLCSGVSG